MRFEKFNNSIHKSNEIATLLYDVDYRTYDLVFKSKEKAVSAISNKLNSSFYDSSLLFVIMENDSFLGIISFLKKDDKSFFKEFKNLFQNLPFIDAFKFLIIDFLDNRVLSDFNFEDLYVAELAISSTIRGQGIGEKVLRKVIDYAKKNNYNNVALDADLRNKKVKSLYERIGFKINNKKCFKPLKRGMYNMIYPII